MSTPRSTRRRKKTRLTRALPLTVVEAEEAAVDVDAVVAMPTEAMAVDVAVVAAEVVVAANSASEASSKATVTTRLTRLQPPSSSPSASKRPRTFRSTMTTTQLCDESWCHPSAIATNANSGIKFPLSSA